MRAYILCVDDEQAVLNQISAQLTRSFGTTHLVECAESAEEALGLMDEIAEAGDRVELVICDQVMPGLKGDRFLEAVHARQPEVMKVLLTGQAGLESAIYAINHAGLHSYIEKPWEPEDLNITIQNLLTQYRLRADLALQRRRLERRSSELTRLHQVGLTLGSTTDVAAIVDEIARAARSVSGASQAAALAQPLPREPPVWGGDLEVLSTAERRALEAELARRRATGEKGAPFSLPARLPVVPLEHRGTPFGWIVLGGGADESSDTDAAELLAILAGQAAAALSNVQLLRERIESERLSTIGRMISSIVHDLRNPMTAIRGYAGMIEDYELPRDRQTDCARLIVEEADRMSLMIDELLEFTRGGTTRLRLSRTTVEELAGRVRRLLEPAFQEKGVQFCTDLQYTGDVLIDMERFKRALLNIASNALDAMGSGGRFTFAARLAGGAVELVLADTGHGIPEEVQERIFEPFFTHGKPRGIGLGMSIARRIVEEHGGSLSFQSRAGEGTRFTVVLPAVS